MTALSTLVAIPSEYLDNCDSLMVGCERDNAVRKSVSFAAIRAINQRLGERDISGQSNNS